jgi:GNAT superfamily N-acetyltransferase
MFRFHRQAPNFDGMRIELADPASPEARRLLEAHASDMAARYGGGGSWEGVNGRKDMLWLARQGGGEAVGCVALRELRADRVEVKHLYVVPDARCRGVGAALMDALEDEAGRRRASIVLETGARQPESLALYRKRCYRPRDKYEGADICGEGALYFER